MHGVLFLFGPILEKLIMYGPRSANHGVAMRVRLD